MLIYMAHPIDGVINTDRYVSLMTRLRVAMPAGSTMYVPSGAFRVGPDARPSAHLSNINNKALEESDAMIAILFARDASTGVGIEIERFVKSGRPVVIIGGEHTWSIRQYENEDNVSYLTEDECLGFDWWKTWWDQHSVSGGGTKRSVSVKWTGDGEQPRFGYEDDAGFDLTYSGSEPLHIDAGDCVDVACGVHIAWPDKTWGFLVGRSSSFRNRGLLVNPAIIDTGFTGELFAIVRNIGEETVTIAPGERVAQVVPLPNVGQTMQMYWVEPDQMPTTARGKSGFGSTGA
jgi:dUTP pyrophosphatase